MKRYFKIYLLLLCILLNQKVWTQTTTNYAYLVVKVDVDFDKKAIKNYYVLNAESGSKSANKVYSLKFFPNEKKAVYDSSFFYFNRNDSSVFFYNYFQNVTECLQFLADDNWELVSIYNKITSSYELQNNGTNILTPTTTIQSNPIYYFKKLVIK